MTVIVKPCSDYDVSSIPVKYDTEDALFATRKAKQYWLQAVEHGALIGCVSFFKVSGKKARVSNLFVAPSHRGKGVGELLVRYAEYWAGKNGFTKIEAITRRSLFIGLGYQPQKTFKKYQLMEKKIENLSK